MRSATTGKRQHLHKGGVAAFPESYSIPRYPDYPNDLNAMLVAEETLRVTQWVSYLHELAQVCHPAVMVRAHASQRAEAFLKCLGLWKEEA